ncbi:MAG: uroporphyrinogen decarboxylase family protein [Promethearchaeota archaeon]|jgi:uroporphyrinogen decarboxylase
MDSFERIWAALNLEQPDVIPTHTINIDGNVADKILDRKTNAIEDLDKLVENFPNDWQDRINPLAADNQASFFSKAIRAAYTLGFDGCGLGYIPFKFESRSELIDIFGKQHKIRDIDGNIYPDYYGGMIKDRKDWESFSKPDFKEIYQDTKKFYKKVLRNCKDIRDEICFMAQNLLTSVFPPVWQGMGMNNFARALKNDPKLIKERFDFTTEFVLTAFKAYSDCGAKIFVEGGDLAFRTGPMVNPKYFDQYLLPCYQEVTNAVHDWGGKIMLHSDGDITTLLDFIIESGFDGLQCLELPYVDPVLVKKKVGHKLCLSGNIDTRYTLYKATKQEVEKAVLDAITAMGEGGGFIISPANFHPEISVDRLKWMIAAVNRFGGYPLKNAA